MRISWHPAKELCEGKCHVQSRPPPATPEQALQQPSVNALKLLRLKSMTCCLQCLRQASHPALDSCWLHELHSILSHSLVVEEPVRKKACQKMTLGPPSLYDLLSHLSDIGQVHHWKECPWPQPLHLLTLMEHFRCSVYKACTVFECWSTPTTS